MMFFLGNLGSESKEPWKKDRGEVGGVKAHTGRKQKKKGLRVQRIEKRTRSRTRMKSGEKRKRVQVGRASPNL
jgi:hypothetical protein